MYSHVPLPHKFEQSKLIKPKLQPTQYNPIT
jgi:hypothetical protein